MITPRGMTPRGPRSAWLTPREPGASPAGSGSGTGDKTLKLAGLGLALGSLSARADPAPGVRPAGKAGELGAIGGPSARRGLQDDIIVPTPRTPEGLGDVQRRHRLKGNPGEACLHWALQNAQVPPPGEGYGIKSCKVEDVAQNFRAGLQLGVAEYLTSRGEAIYQSTTREPLGRAWVRGHPLPPRTREPGFAGFGCAVVPGGCAKETIFPRGVQPEGPEAVARYKLTHGSYAPGEMTDRAYEWPKAIRENPHFRFGVEDGVDTAGRGVGAKTALTMDCVDESLGVPRTRLVRGLVAQFQKVASDHLGTARSLLQGDVGLPKDHTYGIKSGGHEIGVGGLIRGFYTDSEQLPDTDLGRSVQPGRRNFVTKASLGVPSIRLDKPAPPPLRRSVANSTNYGDDPNALGLIFPGKFQFQGVEDTDFQARRSSEELRSILDGAGYRLGSENFQAVFEWAVQLHGDGVECASVEAIMVALSDWKTQVGMPPGRSR